MNTEAPRLSIFILMLKINSDNCVVLVYCYIYSSKILEFCQTLQKLFSSVFNMSTITVAEPAVWPSAILQVRDSSAIQAEIQICSFSSYPPQEPGYFLPNTLYCSPL